MVDLILSESLGGAQVSDLLQGGGGVKTGVDLGQVGSGSYTPIVSKSANTGRQDLFVRHDGTNEISQFSMYLQQYGVGTGYAYGGPGTSSAAADLANLFSLGSASGTSKNNADNLSGGIWIDMKHDVTDVNQFDRAARPTEVEIFGKDSEGQDLASAILIQSSAMVYNSGGIQTPSAPQNGVIGPSGNNVLGEAAYIKMRAYIPSTFLDTGFVQFEVVFSYAFTS